MSLPDKFVFPTIPPGKARLERAADHESEGSPKYNVYLIITLANPSLLITIPFTLHSFGNPRLGKWKTGSHTPPRLKLRLRSRTLGFRQGTLRQMNTPRCSMSQAGEQEWVVPSRVSEMFLCENTFQLKENFCRCPTNLFFPTIPPFSAQERNFKPLTTAIANEGRLWP